MDEKVDWLAIEISHSAAYRDIGLAGHLSFRELLTDEEEKNPIQNMKINTNLCLAESNISLNKKCSDYGLYFAISN